MRFQADTWERYLQKEQPHSTGLKLGKAVILWQTLRLNRKLINAPSKTPVQRAADTTIK